MASKVELRQEIETLCAERGVSIPEGIDRMNFAALTAALAGLQQDAGGGAPPEVPAAGAPPPGLSKVEVEAPPPVVATPAANVVETPLPWEPPPAPEAVKPAEPPPVPTPAAPPAPPSAAPPAAPAAGEPATGPMRYFVARGQCLQNTRKGKIGAFSQVKAKDLPGGEADLEELFRHGMLTRKP